MSDRDTHPVLASLGTVLIDHFTWTDPSTSRFVSHRPPIERLGGGGLYALVGARIWLGPKHLKILVEGGAPKTFENGIRAALRDGDGTKDEVAMGVEGASDEEMFPKELEKELDALGEEMWVWKEGRVLKAIIEYCGEERSFTYLSPPPTRRATDLLSTLLYGAKYVHVVSSPVNCLQLVSDLEGLQAQSTSADIVRSQTKPSRDVGRKEKWRPKFIYEPHPRHCKPEELDALRDVLGRVHILSPNHEELAAFLATPNSTPSTLSSSITQRKTIESHIHALMPSRGIGPDGTGAIVVRAGALGACIGTRGREPRPIHTSEVHEAEDQREGKNAVELSWVPAYWTEEQKGEVRDVTGAGNSFLGGLAAGLYFAEDDAREAALYASVSASYVVQQFGLPVLCSGTNADEDEKKREEAGEKKELWNGESPCRRLEKLKGRMMANHSQLVVRYEAALST